MLTSLLLAIVLPLYTFLAGAISIPYTLVTKDSRPLYWCGRLGVRIGFWLARIRIVTHGKEKVWDCSEQTGRAEQTEQTEQAERSGRRKPGHYIYMMNHNSNLDAPAVWLELPGEVRALGKTQLFKLPVLATAMRLGGFVPVDRSNRERAIASVQSAARLAAAGASFLIAPEGTRSRTGALLPFKKGGFHMAVDSRVPILPVTVVGAFELMPPGSSRIRPGTIDIYFGDPVVPDGESPKERSNLIKRVRRSMQETLDRYGRASAKSPPEAIAAAEPREDEAPVPPGFPGT